MAVTDEREVRSDLLSPAGRVVMLSGASRGIGAAIARRLHSDGFSLSLGVRRPAEVKAKFAEWGNDRLQVSRFDALDPDSAEALARRDDRAASAGSMG